MKKILFFCFILSLMTSFAYANQADQVSNEAYNYLEKGAAYFKQQKYNEAIKQIRQAIQLEPHYLVAYYNLAILFKKLDKEKEAFENFNTALLLARENSDQRMLQKVQAHLRALAYFRLARKTDGFVLIFLIAWSLWTFLVLINKDAFIRIYGEERYLIAKKYAPPSYVCLIIALAIFYFDPFIYSMRLGINVVLFIVFFLVGSFLLTKYIILFNRIAKKDKI